VDAYTVSIAPAQITFASAPPVGSGIVVTTTAAATGVTVSDVIIDGSQIVDNSIANDKLAGSITSDKLAGSITSDKLANVTSTGSTTARSISDRFSDVVNVLDFGAVGNGVADDTAAIQAAIDAVSATGGGAVLFQNGTYKVTSNILIDNDYVGIVGSSQGVTIISDFDGNVIDVGGSAGAKTKGNFIERVTFTETNYSRTVGNPFLKLEQAESVTICDVSFDEVTSPVYQAETLNVQYKNVHIKAHKGTALEWQNAVDTWVDTLHIIGDSVDPATFVTSTEIGIDISNGCSGMYWSGVEIVRQYLGIKFHNRGTSGKTPEWLNAVNVIVDNCKHIGIDIQDLHQGTFTNYWVGYTGYIDSVGGVDDEIGIKITSGAHTVATSQPSTQHLKFDNGIIFNSGREGVSIQDSSTSGRAKTPRNIIFASSNFSASNLANDADTPHVHIYGNIEYITFTGNSFQETVKSAVTYASSCIRLNSGGGNTNLIIKDNQFGNIVGSTYIDSVGGAIITNEGVFISDNSPDSSQLDINGALNISTGAGSPEAAVTAAVGSMYTRTDGGAGTTLYVKESGTGNTGWVAK
jgi:hypothetical protein